MAVVTERVHNGYKLGTSGGMLLGSYTRNQFELSDSLIGESRQRTIEILPGGVENFPVLHFCRCQILYFQIADFPFKMVTFNLPHHMTFTYLS